MSNLLSVKNLSVSYDGKSVFKNISFDVSEGDFLVIFGENGCGKTTLANTLLGLKKPCGGEILFSERLLPNAIGYLPQLIDKKGGFPASVFEVVISGCLNKMKPFSFYKKKEKLIAKKNMELLGIYNLKNECYKNLSGGQMRRVLLARALCGAEKLIILDEPVNGLDPSGKADFYEMILDVNKSGVAVIMISHDVHSSLSVSKHVLKLSEKDFFYGTPAQYEEKTLLDEEN